MGGASKKAIKLEKGIYKRNSIEVRMNRNGKSFYAGGIDTIEEARAILATFTGEVPTQPNTGIDNNAMRGGVPQGKMYNFRKFRQEVAQNSVFYCLRCETDKDIKHLNIHHIDHNRANDTIINFEVLCSTCHREHHNERNEQGQYT